MQKKTEKIRIYSENITNLFHTKNKYFVYLFDNLVLYFFSKLSSKQLISFIRLWSHWKVVKIFTETYFLFGVYVSLNC